MTLGAAPSMTKAPDRSGSGGRTMPAPAMTAAEIANLLHKEFPQAFYEGCGLTLERVGYGDIRVRRDFHADQVRPGG